MKLFEIYFLNKKVKHLQIVISSKEHLLEKFKDDVIIMRNCTSTSDEGKEMYNLYKNTKCILIFTWEPHNEYEVLENIPLSYIVG